MKKRFVKPASFVKLFGFAFVLAMITGLSSCTQYEILPPDDVGEVTFSETIQPIFTANCAGCHNGTGHPLNLGEGSAFAALQAYTPEQGGQTINTDNPEESVLYIMALDGAHGYFNLSGKEKAQILQWITDGAPNN